MTISCSIYILSVLLGVMALRLTIFGKVQGVYIYIRMTIFVGKSLKAL